MDDSRGIKREGHSEFLLLSESLDLGGLCTSGKQSYNRGDIYNLDPDARDAVQPSINACLKYILLEQPLTAKSIIFALGH